jgi:hypothetical protein
MGGSNSAHELVLLDQAGQALAEARTLGEIKTIRDKAEAVRKYAQSASLGLGVQNRAAEVKLRAERQAGKLLSQLMLRGGDRRSKSHSDRLKLDDLGLTPNQSKRWQLQARVPDNLFLDHVKQTCEEGKELTSAGLMRLAIRIGERTSNGRSLNGNPTSRNKSKLRRKRRWTDENSVDGSGGIVRELKNHHTLLYGILSPLCAGEILSLRPAELRMVRYLLAESGELIEQLSSLALETTCRTCQNDRIAS